METAIAILISLTVGAVFGFIMCTLFVSGRTADEIHPGQEG